MHTDSKLHTMFLEEKVLTMEKLCQLTNNVGLEEKAYPGENCDVFIFNIGRNDSFLTCLATS